MALEAWKKARLSDLGRTLLRRLDGDDEACWETYATLVRNWDPKLGRELALPLWKTGDKVLRTNLIRTLDWERPNERKLIQELIGECDGQRDEPELLAAVEKGPAAAQHVARRVAGLSQEVHAVVEARRSAGT
jgi:hypothetical protein